MDTKGFSIGYVLKEGWNLWKEKWLFLTGIVLFTLLLPAIPQILIALLPSDANLASFILGVIHFIFGVIANMGLITITLKLAKAEPCQFSDYFSKIHLFPSYLWALILFYLAVFVGLILLIVPGVIVALMFCLWPYFILDKQFPGVDSLKASKSAVYGSKWDLFLLWVATFLINLLGLLCLGVGLLITMPVTMLAWAFVYLKLTQKSEA